MKRNENPTKAGYLLLARVFSPAIRKKREQENLRRRSLAVGSLALCSLATFDATPANIEKLFVLELLLALCAMVVVVLVVLCCVLGKSTVTAKTANRLLLCFVFLSCLVWVASELDSCWTRASLIGFCFFFFSFFSFFVFFALFMLLVLGLPAFCLHTHTDVDYNIVYCFFLATLAGIFQQQQQDVEM